MVLESGMFLLEQVESGDYPNLSIFYIQAVSPYHDYGIRIQAECFEQNESVLCTFTEAVVDYVIPNVEINTDSNVVDSDKYYYEYWIIEDYKVLKETYKIFNALPPFDGFVKNPDGTASLFYQGKEFE